jgi:hypothetical protein
MGGPVSPLKGTSTMSKILPIAAAVETRTATDTAAHRWPLNSVDRWNPVQWFACRVHVSASNGRSYSVQVFTDGETFKTDIFGQRKGVLPAIHAAAVQAYRDAFMAAPEAAPVPAVAGERLDAALNADSPHVLTFDSLAELGVIMDSFNDAASGLPAPGPLPEAAPVAPEAAPVASAPEAAPAAPESAPAVQDTPETDGSVIPASGFRAAVNAAHDAETESVLAAHGVSRPDAFLARHERLHALAAAAHGVTVPAMPDAAPAGFNEAVDAFLAAVPPGRPDRPARMVRRYRTRSCAGPAPAVIRSAPVSYPVPAAWSRLPAVLDAEPARLPAARLTPSESVRRSLRCAEIWALATRLMAVPGVTRADRERFIVLAGRACLSVRAGTPAQRVWLGQMRAAFRRAVAGRSVPLAS